MLKRYKMKKIGGLGFGSKIAIILPLALVGALAVSFPVQAATRTPSSQKAPPATAYHNKWASTPRPPLPVSGPPGICGPWSAAGSAQVLAIRSAHGVLDSCQLVDHFWVMTTYSVTGPAQIGVLTCLPTDSTCMNGWLTKNLAACAWYKAPPAVTQLKIYLVQGNLLIMITNDGQWTFNIDTRVFVPMKA